MLENQVTVKGSIVDFSLIQLLPNGRVSARKLQIFLESKQEFSPWIKKLIEDYDFADVLDFDKVIKPMGISKITDYELRISCAKEICMVSKTEKGKQARKYFIVIEEKAKQQPQFKLPSNYKEALVALVVEVEKNEQLGLQLEDQKEKVQFADRLLQADDELNFGLTAKVLKLPFGSKTLFSICRSNFWIDDKNIPYQSMITRKYFNVIEKISDSTDPYDHVYFQTVITIKGQKWLLKQLKKLNLIGK